MALKIEWMLTRVQSYFMLAIPSLLAFPRHRTSSFVTSKRFIGARTYVLKKENKAFTFGVFISHKFNIIYRNVFRIPQYQVLRYYERINQRWARIKNFSRVREEKLSENVMPSDKRGLIAKIKKNFVQPLNIFQENRITNMYVFFPLIHPYVVSTRL